MKPIDILRRKYTGSAVALKRQMQFSSIHARTYAGQRGKIFGFYADGDRQILAAIVLLKDVAWVDVRDITVEAQ